MADECKAVLRRKKKDWYVLYLWFLVSTAQKTRSVMCNKLTAPAFPTRERLEMRKKTDGSCKSRSHQPVVCTSQQQPDFPMPSPLFVQLKRNKWKSWNIGIYGKRGSFRKRACLTEIPRIMEKWQKGKHGKGIVKQHVTETVFCYLDESHREHKDLLTESRRWSEIYGSTGHIILCLHLSVLHIKLLSVLFAKHITWETHTKHFTLRKQEVLGA